MTHRVHGRMGAVDVGPLDWIFRSDVLVVAAAAAPSGASEITRSLGARRVAARGLRIYVPVPESLHFLNLGAETGQLAVLFGRPRDYRSVQLKVHDARPVATSAEDAAAFTKYRAELGPALEPMGIPAGLWELLMSREVVTVEATISSAWQQTPGAGSGTRIEQDAP